MSTFGLSGGDILIGIQLCKWLYDTCFDKNNSADERYKALGRDVELLYTKLQQLEKAFNKALRRYESPDFESFDTDFEAADLKKDAQRFRCDLQDLVGNVHDTLKQCEEILAKHVRLQKYSGVIKNVVWATTAQDKVDVLRKQIQFHSQKISLVVEPVKLEILTTMDEKLDKILDRLDNMQALSSVPNPLPSIPDWLKDRFRNAMLENPPDKFTDTSKIPLREGFDALYTHFRESTNTFRDPDGIGQTAEQYLNLLKSQWLLDILRQSEPFKQAKLGSLFPRAVAKIARRLSDVYKRSDLVRFPEEKLQELTSTAFLIWPPEQVIEIRFMTDPSDGEEEILKLSLPASSGNGKDDLVLFRTGPSILRIVRNVVPLHSGFQYYESERLNIHMDRFIPFYAVQESSIHQRRGSKTTSTVAIYRANETGETAYEMKEEIDLFNFQRAVTGYQVVGDTTCVKWALKHSTKPKGKGRLQLWFWKPLAAKDQNHETGRRESTSSSSTIGPKSGGSGATNATIEQLLDTTDRSMITVEQSSDNNSTIGASTPPAPVIMIYTQIDNEYSYLHLELEPTGLQIVPSACNCSTTPQNCRVTVIKRLTGNGSELPFTVRRLLVKGEENINSWNLSLFAQPRHPDFYNRKVLEEMSCKFLNLDFATFEDKRTFDLKLNNALNLRDDAEKQFRALCIRTQRLADQPRQVPRSSTSSVVPPLPLSPRSMMSQPQGVHSEEERIHRGSHGTATKPQKSNRPIVTFGKLLSRDQKKSSSNGNRSASTPEKSNKKPPQIPIFWDDTSSSPPTSPTKSEWDWDQAQVQRL